MSSKETPTTRPHSQQRLSMTSNGTTTTAGRPSSARHHSHSVSLGSINPTHRVTRRKSINATAINNQSAVQAALNDLSRGGSTSVFDSNIQGNRRSIAEFSRSDANQGRSSGFLQPDNNNVKDSAVADGPAPAASHQPDSLKPRARRASEGSYLSKGEGKRSSGELRCETCGKGYKHSSCLTKHLWEHDPAWAVTSKFLISKHQQVQLLEAASVLVNINQDALGADDVKHGESDNSSVSPAASGSSEVPDEYESIYSSAETTPPPMNDQYTLPEDIGSGRTKRSSGISSSYSRSYQSAPSGSLPTSNGFSQYSSPVGYTSGIATEEEGSLAAAVETLCSFGTPRSGALYLPANVPPVPPLPARYLEQNQGLKSGNMLPQPDLGLPSPSYHPLSNERDVRMGDHRLSFPGVHSDATRERDRNDVDEGVFGVMEGISQENHGDLK